MKQLHNKVNSLNNHYEAVKTVLQYETAYFKDIKVKPIDLFKVDGTLKQKYQHDHIDIKKLFRWYPMKYVTY